MRYELTLEALGRYPDPQLGWATPAFARAVGAEAAAGVGDDGDSWAADGCRGSLFHGGAEAGAWPADWAAGDVIGAAADLDSGTLWFARNGKWAVAFENVAAAGGLYPAFSAKGITFRLNLGAAPFRHPPPFRHLDGASFTAAATAGRLESGEREPFPEPAGKWAHPIPPELLRGSGEGTALKRT